MEENPNSTNMEDTINFSGEEHSHDLTSSRPETNLSRHHNQNSESDSFHDQTSTNPNEGQMSIPSTKKKKSSSASASASPSPKMKKTGSNHNNKLNEKKSLGTTNANSNFTQNPTQNNVNGPPKSTGKSSASGGMTFSISNYNNSNSNGSAGGGRAVNNISSNNTSGVKNSNKQSTNLSNNSSNNGSGKNYNGKTIASQSGSTLNTTSSRSQNNQNSNQNQNHHHQSHAPVPSHIIPPFPYNAFSSNNNSQSNRNMLRNTSNYSQMSQNSQFSQQNNTSSGGGSSNGSNHFNSGLIAKSQIGFDRSRNLRQQVEKAIRERHVFSCFGVFPAVRRSLLKRGWIEKNPGVRLVRSTNLTSSFRDNEHRGFEMESDQAWMTRVLRDYPPDFVWILRRDTIDWRNIHKEQLINRHPRAYFTTKVGITWCIQSMQWFSEQGVAETYFPRCYRLCIDEEKSAFVDDFRLCACMGLLKWVVGAYEKEGESGVMDSNQSRSSVNSGCVDFAIKQVNNYVRVRRHEDIDWQSPPASPNTHWDSFLNQYYTIVILKAKLAPSDNDSAKVKFEASKRALQRAAPFWPQLNLDGVNNVWICKPGARSRGKGIVLMNKLDKILELLAQSNVKESNWVVQKYIERPLLIYKTKFDIRQWFIVSDWNPLTIWFYKECYIRFCTKTFSLDDFHESIHLCNNAVQCRYQNAQTRDSALPNDNMWDNYTFQAYLKTLGKMDLWDTVIYPGMKQAILGIMLASQEAVDVRRGCFELYGADFMCSEDFRPWLIEINSSPCMAATTNVTARMCNQCLEDTVKVIVDRREDRNCSTGMFELIYKANATNMPFAPWNGMEYPIVGKKLNKEVDWPSIMTKYNSKRGSTVRMIRAAQKPSALVSGMTFRELITRLRLKDAQTNSPLAPGPGSISGNGTGTGSPPMISTPVAPFVTLSNRIMPLSTPSTGGQLLSNFVNTNMITSINLNNQQEKPNLAIQSSSKAIFTLEKEKEKEKKEDKDKERENVKREKVASNFGSGNQNPIPGAEVNTNGNSSSISSSTPNSNPHQNSGAKNHSEKPKRKTDHPAVAHQHAFHSTPIPHANQLSSFTNNLDPESHNSTVHKNSVLFAPIGQGHKGSSIKSATNSLTHSHLHAHSHSKKSHRPLTVKEQQHENHKIIDSLTETFVHKKGHPHPHNPSQNQNQNLNQNPTPAQQQIQIQEEVQAHNHLLQEFTVNMVAETILEKNPHLNPVNLVHSELAKNLAVPTLPMTSQGTTMVQLRIVPKKENQNPPVSIPVSVPVSTTSAISPKPKNQNSTSK